MLRLVLCLCLLLVLPASAFAGDVSVTLRTPQGAPIVNAVVIIEAPHTGPVRFDWPYRMAQQNLQFDPFVLIVPVGAEVAFPNLDKVRHHVYSFSPAKTFELKLYGQDETRVVNFDKPGVVPLGCNIHDNMVAFVVVVDTPWAARTDVSGQAVLRGVPAGPQTLHVWHPYLIAPGNALAQPVAVPRDGAALAQVTGQLRAPLQQRRMY
jgi:plastocyanin